MGDEGLSISPVMVGLIEQSLVNVSDLDIDRIDVDVIEIEVKELQSRFDELDEEVAVERNNRVKAERKRSLLSRDLEDLGTRLDKAGSKWR